MKNQRKKTIKKTAKRKLNGKTTPDATDLPELPASDPKKKPFEPENLDRTVIAIPLLKILEKEEQDRAEDPKLGPKAHKVIIDLNL